MQKMSSCLQIQHNRTFLNKCLLNCDEAQRQKLYDITGKGVKSALSDKSADPVTDKSADPVTDESAWPALALPSCNFDG